MIPQQEKERLKILDGLQPTEVNLRTVMPNRNHQPTTTGANLMKVVEDYGKIEDGELTDEISQLEYRLARARLRQEYINRLQAVIDDFKEASAELEKQFATT